MLWPFRPPRLAKERKTEHLLPGQQPTQPRTLIGRTGNVNWIFTIGCLTKTRSGWRRAVLWRSGPEFIRYNFPDWLADDVRRLLDALKAMLDVRNWTFVLQTQVPERVQYAAVRDNFDQEAKVKNWNIGFFQLCRPGTPHGACTLGEHCQCRFYAELFAGFVDEKRSPEEEGDRQLECEIRHSGRLLSNGDSDPGTEWTGHPRSWNPRSDRHPNFGQRREST